MFSIAKQEVGFFKSSIYGPPGSGKSTLMILLLIYLSKTYHNSAPIAVLASEKGIDFLIAIAKAEGVPLLVKKSSSFIDAKNAHDGAIKDGCCGLGIDSTSHFWSDLFGNGMNTGSGSRLNRIMQIKQEWAPFAAAFQDSPIHSIATGRLGYKWEDAEVEVSKVNRDGQKEMSIEREVMRGGSKMKAEGDFGHEPDIELEMSSIEDPDALNYEKVRGRTRKTFSSHKVHIATVKKSRVWALNGKAFTWKDQPEYKVGYCGQVAKPFQPYFEAIAIGGAHHVGGQGPDTSALFAVGNEQSAHENSIRKQIAIEKWDGTITMLAAGSTGQAQRHRAIIGAEITGTRSKTEFERLPLSRIEGHLLVLLALEKRWELPGSEDDLRAMIQLAQQDVENEYHSGKGKTLLEVRLEQSLNGGKIRPGSTADFRNGADKKKLAAF